MGARSFLCLVRVPVPIRLRTSPTFDWTALDNQIPPFYPPNPSTFLTLLLSCHKSTLNIYLLYPHLAPNDVRSIETNISKVTSLYQSYL